MSTEYPALLAYSPSGAPDWRLGNVKVIRSPKEHELKIRMVATGICHSDLVFASIPGELVGAHFPRVLGHEGAGVVEEVGPGVTVAKPGDSVLLSFNFCKDCDLCHAEQESCCLRWPQLNVVGEQGILETADGTNADAKFFGQSSFAGINIVSETSVVNVSGLVKNHDELKLMAPLGCGLMTGSGAIRNVAKPKPYDIVVVTGMGAVGMGAMFAAVISGCKEVVAIDRVASRLELAKELGATKTMDTSTVDGDLAEAVQKLVGGQRISYVVETTGAVAVIEAATKMIGKRGKVLQQGIPGRTAVLSLPLSSFLSDGKAFECNLLGDTTGQRWIPEMLTWWREGKFPIEKLVKFYPIKDALTALHDMHAGTTIKPVLVY